MKLLDGVVYHLEDWSQKNGRGWLSFLVVLGSTLGATVVLSALLVGTRWLLSLL